MKQLDLKKLQNRLRDKFLKSRVKMIAPETIYFSKDTKIGKNVTIEPYVVFGSKVKIGNNVIIKSFTISFLILSSWIFPNSFLAWPHIDRPSIAPAP